MTSLGMALIAWPLMRLGPAYRDAAVTYFPADLREGVTEEADTPVEIRADLLATVDVLVAHGFGRVAFVRDDRNLQPELVAVGGMYLWHPTLHTMAFIGTARKQSGECVTYTSVGAWNARGTFFGVTNQAPTDGPGRRHVRFLRGAAPTALLDALNTHLPPERRAPCTVDEMWTRLSEAQWRHVAWRVARGRYVPVSAADMPLLRAAREHEELGTFGQTAT